MQFSYHGHAVISVEKTSIVVGATLQSLLGLVAMVKLSIWATRIISLGNLYLLWPCYIIGLFKSSATSLARMDGLNIVPLNDVENSLHRAVDTMLASLVNLYTLVAAY